MSRTMLALLLASVVAPSVANAKACKVEVDEIDQFSGNVKRVTVPVALGSTFSGDAAPSKASVSARRDGAELALEFRLVMSLMFAAPSTQMTADPADRSVTLLLGDGQQVKLFAVSAEAPQMKALYGAMAIEELWTLPADAATLLMDEPAVALRYQGAFHRFDLDITGKPAEALSSAIRCVTQ